MIQNFWKKSRKIRQVHQQQSRTSAELWDEGTSRVDVELALPSPKVEAPGRVDGAGWRWYSHPCPPNSSSMSLLQGRDGPAATRHQQPPSSGTNPVHTCCPDTVRTFLFNSSLKFLCSLVPIYPLKISYKKVNIKN